jgi:hypothetical protein
VGYSHARSAGGTFIYAQPRLSEFEIFAILLQSKNSNPLREFRLSISDLAFAALIWVLLIARYGYTYGTNDHIELLPYVLFLKNMSLYPHDLFIQSLHASLPNERTVMAHLLMPFADHLRPTIFILHFLNTVLLILALIKLAGRFIENKYLTWLAVYTSVVFLNDKGLGNVDLYTPAIQAGDVSCMIIAWALNVFLDKKYIAASLIMSLATFIHVLEGFDSMAILCGIILLKYVFDKEIGWREVASFFGIYFMTAGVYLFFIYRAKTSGAGAMSSQELFQIMFAFRHPHHFIFSTFPIFNKLLFVFCFIASAIFYPGRSRTVTQYIAIATLVLIVYIVCVDYLQLVFVANFQWYKVVQWTKFLGLTAAFGLVASYMRAYWADENKWVNYLVLPVSMLAVCFLFYQYANGFFDTGYKQYNETEIALCSKVKELTPNDAVFIQPFEMTALKFYGQRSSYVEFKAIAKNQKDLKIWYERVQEVFGLNYDVDKSGFDMRSKANEHLDNLDESQLAQLKKEGVTNVICRTTKYEQGHKLILAENGYYVYEL